MARRVVLARTAAVVAFVLGVALVGLVPAQAASLEATIVKDSSWSNGFTARVTVTNTSGSPVTGWQVEFDLPPGTTVGTFWDALLTSSEDDHYVFVNRNYNATVPAGGSVGFGFVGGGTGDPSNCTVNGAACDGDGPPTTPPTTSPPTTSPPTTSPPTTVPPTTSPPTTTPPTTSPPTTRPPPSDLPEHVLVGYLHASFANGSGYVRMEDVPDEWDVINLAFGEPTSPTSGRVEFQRCPVSQCPNVESEAEFIAAIRAHQAEGNKVLISIGGANGQVQLATTAARDAFVSSVSAIIDRYGLDGLDIDFEGHSLFLDPGDTDFRNPTTPVIVNLISALRTLTARYGEDFVLTMAPETFFVQLGYQFYGSGANGTADPRAGSYLPVIHALRDDLTLLHVQDYNSGPIMGLDDQFHFMGSADFHVAMTDMLLTGFPVQRNPDHFFAPLPPEKVAIGLPASVNAGNGFTPVGEVHLALDCLMKGQRCGSYQPHGVFRNMRGLMTWSINWDRFNNFEFSRNHRAYFDAL